MKTMLAAYLPEIRPSICGKLRCRRRGLTGTDQNEILRDLRKRCPLYLSSTPCHSGGTDKPLYGFINGHEPCGQIVAMGQGCRHFKEGDRVLVYHISGCGFARTAVAVFLFLVLAKEKRLTAGSVTAVMPNTCWRKKRSILLPDALSYEDGAFISCGVGTAYEGILRGEVSGSDNVLVVGLGPVGMMAMMLAKGRGAKRIIGVDMLPERLAMAKQLGVMDHGYLATTEGLPQIIAELTHGGADVALDCSGNAAGRLLALQSTADWGRVVYIGETGKVEFEVSADLMHHQRRIIGSWVTSLFHMEKCAHDLTDWKLWPRNAITHRFSLEQAGDAYALMASGKCGKVVINFPD